MKYVGTNEERWSSYKQQMYNAVFSLLLSGLYGSILNLRESVRSFGLANSWRFLVLHA